MLAASDRGDQHIRPTSRTSCHPQAPMIGCRTRCCLLLVSPAIWALKGSWANNQEHFVDICRASKSGASCGVVDIATLAARVAHDFHREFSSRAHSQGFVLISATLPYEKRCCTRCNLDVCFNIWFKIWKLRPNAAHNHVKCQNAYFTSHQVTTMPAGCCHAYMMYRIRPGSHGRPDHYGISTCWRPIFRHGTRRTGKVFGNGAGAAQRHAAVDSAQRATAATEGPIEDRSISTSTITVRQLSATQVTTAVRTYFLS